MKKKLEKIILSSIVIAIFLCLLYFINLAKECNILKEYYKNIVETSQNEKKSEKWATYHDEKYGYRINYLVGLDVENMHNHKIILSADSKKYQTVNGGVNFSLGGGPGVSVEIFENSPILSLEEWLDTKNKEKTSSHYVIDSYREVDGIPSISIYEVSNSGEVFKSPQITAFLKNKNLFVIFTGEDNRDIILDSFKFDQ